MKTIEKIFLSNDEDLGNDTFIIESPPDAFRQIGRTLRLSIKSLWFINYFLANPEGPHFVIMTRADLQRLKKPPYSGVGFIAGTLLNNGVNELPATGPNQPRGIIQTWGAGMQPKGARFIYPRTATPLLEDNVEYSLTIESTLGIDGWNYIGYQMYRVNDDKSSYDLVRNVGWVRDNNIGVQMQLNNIVFHVTGGSLIPGKEVGVKMEGIQLQSTDSLMILPDLT